MSNHGVNPLLRLARATRYSVSGIQAALRYEQAFRQELLVLAIAVPLGLRFGHGALGRIVLIGSWWLVLIVELINSSIEAAVDRGGSGRDDLAGRSKDLGSAAVFCTLLLALMAWVLILAGH
jgi:diacylglycerol kinase (ATP)